MKILLVLLIISITLLAAESKEKKDSQLCKFFTKKVVDYKKNMREDAYAYQTLHSYEKRAEKFCK